MKLEFYITEEIVLCDFLKQQDISDKFLASIKADGDLRVNYQHVTVRYILKRGDYLEVIFPPEKRGKQLTAFLYPLDIVYEDEFLLVINKPSQMPCIPDHRYHDKTLANAIIGYYQKIQLDSTIHFVNRLDKETSGLLIVAKYRYIHYLLSKQHIERRYIALVGGEMSDQSICLPIYRESASVKRCIDIRGKEALTHCKVVEKNKKYSIVDCQLETGRTHQIRVHLSAVGHSLIGDLLYGGLPNQAHSFFLHSYEVKFIHPVTKQECLIQKKREIHEDYYQ